MRTPGSGRKPGTPNKDKQSLLETAEALGVNPFEFLCLTMKGDWKALGIPRIEHEERTEANMLVKSWSDPVVPFTDRYAAASQLCQYLYPKRSAVKLTADEDSGFRVIIEDYTSKKEKPDEK